MQKNNIKVVSMAYYVRFALPPLLPWQEGKTAKDTDVSSWRGLLDEFADEGSVDCTIMGHQLERVGLTPGAGGSGLRNLKHGI